LKNSLLRIFENKFLKFKFKYELSNSKYSYYMGIGDWGLGIGDWGLGPIPNPQSPNLNLILKVNIKI
jgi:hypothetical protein